MRISNEHLKHWLEHGYAVVEEFLTPQELATAQGDLHATFPSREEYSTHTELYRNDARGGHMRECPYLTDALNEMPLHSEIISFVEEALRTKNLMLAQSLVWAKYPGGDDYEQPLHMDYMNTSMLYPNTRKPWEEVTFILYYSNIDETLGPTYVVSNQERRTDVFVPYARPKEKYPDLYKDERPIVVSAGSLLIYSMGTVHRASRITSKDRIRFTHHIIYRSGDAPWIGYRMWANYGLSAEMQRFIERLSPRQREILGFPEPGDAYWTEETLRGIAARYSAMDMDVYIDRAALPQADKGSLREQLRRPRSSETGVTSVEDSMRELAEISTRQSPLEAAYYQGIADYCAAVTGISADQWLQWLMTYVRKSP
jgi:ectoine hydroxylase-related dioxygenase (phytanoyl-CoA dioxygenase family)